MDHHETPRNRGGRSAAHGVSAVFTAIRHRAGLADEAPADVLRHTALVGAAASGSPLQLERPR
jgi:hypothetical protein